MKIQIGDKVQINRTEVFTHAKTVDTVKVSWVSKNGEIFEYRTGWGFSKNVIGKVGA